MASIYESLSPEGLEIRLLTIKSSGDEASPICCTIEKASLRDMPAYVALSYVWGDAAVTEQIIINDLPMAITTNLAAALRQIRVNFGSIVIWVDAVCINQFDTLEKSHQVQSMGLIYKLATKVISWLGPEKQNSSLALQMLSKVAYAVTQGGVDDHRWMEQVPELFNPDADEEVFECWKSMLDLLFRPYWNRAWIMQEVALAARLLVLCGSATATWEALESACEACEAIAMPEGHRKLALPEAVWNKYISLINWGALGKIKELRKTRRDGEQQLTIISLVYLTWSTKVTDPRDKIYSLGGLLPGLFIPDYAKPVDELYCKFARDWIIKARNMSVLAFADHDGCSTEDIGYLNRLPSWVPDWDGISKGVRRPVKVLWYEASLRSEPRTQISSDSRILWSHGILVDNVDSVESLFTISEIEKQLPSICRSYCSSGDPEYAEGISKLQALLRVILGDIDPTSDKRIEQTTQSFKGLATAFVIYSAEGFDTVCVRTDPELGSKSILDSANPSIRHPSSYDISLDASMYWQMILRYSISQWVDRRIFQTKKGFLGVGPSRMRVDDTICVLYGCDAPAVLRREGSHYIFIGLCLVLGLMDGEAILAAAKYKEVEFEIH